MMTSVLLVEPDRALAKTMAEFLREQELDVRIAVSSQQAIRLADEQRPDIVVLELAIPGHNGIEFLQEFRSYADWLEVPVVIYSHVPVENTGLTLREWRKHGVVDYLYKPVVGLERLTKRLINETA